MTPRFPPPRRSSLRYSPRSGGTKFSRCASGAAWQRQADRKGRARIFLAGHGNASLHALDDALGDRKSQSRAAEFPSGGAVSLLEVEKYAREVCVFQTDPGVAHFKTNFIFIIALFGNDLDTALLGKLDRIADKIEQNLSQACNVAYHLRWQALVDIRRYFYSFRLRTGSHELDRFFNQRGQRERACLEIELSSFDLGEIENLLDKRQQAFHRTFWPRSRR